MTNRGGAREPVVIFKHHHLLDELRQKGCKGTGEILSMQTLDQSGKLKAAWSPDENLSTTWSDCRMKLRVTPDDRGQTPFEATVMTRIHTFKFQGFHVPVWYDPADLSRVVVDYEADLERLNQAQQEADALTRQAELSKHRYEQRAGLAWTPLGRDLLPVEVAARPGQGRAVPDAEVAGLLREPAEAALSYVRDNAARLLPELPGGWFAAHDLRVFQPYGPPPADPAVQGKDAGLAIAAALVSVLSGRIVRPEVAVTGGLTAAGELLPAAKLKDKLATTRRGFLQHLVAPAVQAPAHHDGDPELVLVATADEALAALVARHRMKGYTPPA